MLKSLKKIGLNRLNWHSWTLIAFFILASYVTEFFSGTHSLESFFISLPLILFVTCLCQMNARLTSIIAKKRNWGDFVIQDTFLISYCFLFGGILGAIVNYNSPDSRAWWAFSLYIIFFEGLVFSLVFSAISWTLNYHNHIYNAFFNIIIILLLSSLKIFPLYIQVGSFKNIDIWYVILFGLLTAHFLFTILFKLLKISGDYVRKN